jgi:SAM-dependent methyltransferase
MMSDRFERMTEMYEQGNVPWDHGDPPPEVLDFVPTLPAGRALDLGCGLGRAAIFMAKLGWQVDGVDFVAQAITEARQRAAAAGATGAHFHQSAVTELDFLAGPYDFALDVGCAHSFNADDLQSYVSHLRRLLKPGGTFLLFSHLSDDSAPPDERRWIDESTLLAAFNRGFTLARAEYGQTVVRDDTWNSAWFWFTRTADD